jgi:rhodanese-related sulfurtransferase
MVVLALLAAGVLLAALAAAGEAPRIAKEKVKAKLGSAGVVIIDVRAPRDWKGSDAMIKGAVREDPGKVEEWAGNYPKEKTLILYCA